MTESEYEKRSRIISKEGIRQLIVTDTELDSFQKGKQWVNGSNDVYTIKMVSDMGLVYYTVEGSKKVYKEEIRLFLSRCDALDSLVDV